MLNYPLVSRRVNTAASLGRWAEMASSNQLHTLGWGSNTWHGEGASSIRHGTDPKTNPHKSCWSVPGAKCGNKLSQLNDNRQGYLFKAHCKGVGHGHLHFSRDSKAGRTVGKPCRGIKGRPQICLTGGCWHGSWKWANQMQGILGDWLGEHIWLSLVGPKLQAGARTRKSINY